MESNWKTSAPMAHAMCISLTARFGAGLKATMTKDMTLYRQALQLRQQEAARQRRG